MTPEEEKDRDDLAIQLHKCRQELAKCRREVNYGLDMIRDGLYAQAMGNHEVMTDLAERVAYRLENVVSDITKRLG